MTTVAVSPVTVTVSEAVDAEVAVTSTVVVAVTAM
jgi:hypothetical protein